MIILNCIFCDMVKRFGTGKVDIRGVKNHVDRKGSPTDGEPAGIVERD